MKYEKIFYGNIMCMFQESLPITLLERGAYLISGGLKEKLLYVNKHRCVLHCVILSLKPML